MYNKCIIGLLACSVKYLLAVANEPLFVKNIFLDTYICVRFQFRFRKIGAYFKSCHPRKVGVAVYASVLGHRNAVQCIGSRTFED